MSLRWDRTCTGAARHRNPCGRDTAVDDTTADDRQNNINSNGGGLLSVCMTGLKLGFFSNFWYDSELPHEADVLMDKQYGQDDIVVRLSGQTSM